MIAAFITFSFLLAPTSQPIVSALPTEKELQGWKPMADALVHVKGAELTQLYNGGFEVWTSRGVLEAAAQTYKKDKLYMTITAHRLSTPAKAKAIVAYWKAKQKESRPSTLNIAGGTGYWVQAAGATNLYWQQSQYYATFEIPKATPEAKAASLAARAVWSKKLKAALKKR